MCVPGAYRSRFLEYLPAARNSFESRHSLATVYAFESQPTATRYEIVVRGRRGLPNVCTDGQSTTSLGQSDGARLSPKVRMVDGRWCLRKLDQHSGTAAVRRRTGCSRLGVGEPGS